MYSETSATRKIKALKKRIRAVQGGSSASKTISILLYLIARAQSDKTPTITSVVSESIPHLKRGAQRDFKNIMQTHHYWKDANWNVVDSTYTFETGSIMEFFSTDNGDKLRGARRDRCFMNEANNCTFEAFEQLEIRTKEFFFLDWNPSNEFFFYTDILGKRDDVEHIILTYLDNEALDPAIKTALEQRKNRANWWKVYGLGQLGDIEGRIYTGWQIIDAIPHEARLERYGLDFGYTCLVGETQVQTNKGDKRLDTIKVGDKVRTRNGYKEVTNTIDRGLRSVYRLDFGYGKSIIGTGDHRVYTKDGWKQIDQLSNNETLCLQKKSLSIIKNTKDTQKGNIQTISSLLTKTRQGYTGIYIQNTRERFLKGLLYITLMAMPLTTTFQTLSRSLQKNTLKFTTHLVNGMRQQRGRNNSKGLGFQKITGKSEGISVLKQQNAGSRIVLSVVRISCLLMSIRSSVVRNVERLLIQGKVKKNMFVRIVEFISKHQLTIREHLVHESVLVSCVLLKEKRRVFDISVAGDKEFFANSVLVHNCDPSSVVAIYHLNGGYILDEIIHAKGLSNKQIADILLNQPRKALIVADSAEPKSIDELRVYGLSVVAANKGKDSVTNGIQMVQDQQISVTKNSVNVIKEYRNYLWLTDKDGRVLNEPDHTWSHSMDAIRYGITSLHPIIRAKEMLDSMPRFVPLERRNPAR